MDLTISTEQSVQDMVSSEKEQVSITLNHGDDMSDCVCTPDAAARERRQKDKEGRLSLVLWKRPVTTLQYFLLETLVKLKELALK